MEITIIVESTDPLIGRVVTRAPGATPAATGPGIDASFLGWLGLLRLLDDVIGSPAGPHPSPPESPPRSLE